MLLGIEAFSGLGGDTCGRSHFGEATCGVEDASTDFVDINFADITRRRPDPVKGCAGAVWVIHRNRSDLALGHTLLPTEDAVKWITQLQSLTRPLRDDASVPRLFFRSPAQFAASELPLSRLKGTCVAVMCIGGIGRSEPMSNRRLPL